MGTGILVLKRRNPGFQCLFGGLLDLKSPGGLVKQIGIEHGARGLEIPTGNAEDPSCFAVPVRGHKAPCRLY